MTGAHSVVDPSEVRAAVAAVQSAVMGFGKLEISPKVNVSSLHDIATLYTPGVGALVRRIMQDPEALDVLSNRGNTIAVVTDGTAVLGFGDAGPRAALPVMEGKAIMFKLLAGLDAVPICLDVRDPARLVEHIAGLEPNFAGFNLEDVAAPHCFSVVEELTERVTVPVFHDDQYGTATVIVAGLMNAAKVIGKKKEDLRVVVNGAGAAGTAAVRLISRWGVGDIIACDRHGIIARSEKQPAAHMDMLAAMTNREGKVGALADALQGADVFVGLSRGGLLDATNIRSMAKSAIVFACANPDPEIMPSVAIAAGAAVAGSGRFDAVNQCNNVLAFPGIMRGAVDIAAKRVTETMCLAASRVIAGSVGAGELSPRNVLPGPLSPDLCSIVAEAVAAQGAVEGIARKPYRAGEISARVRDHNRRSAQQQLFLQNLLERSSELTVA